MIAKTKIRNKNDYEAAAHAIKREVDEKLGAGSPAEVFDLCRYARERTRLSKADDDLTDSQLAWKQYYNLFFNALMENFSSEEKNQLTKMMDLYYGMDIMNDEVDLLRAVEALFIQQEGLFLYYEDKAHPQNLYQARLDAGVKTMAAASTPTEAVASARTVLKLVETTRNLLVGGIKNLQQELHDRLEELVVAHERTRSLLNAAHDSTTSPQTQEDGAAETADWIHLPKELLKASITRTDALGQEFKIDALFADIIIAKQGANPNQMSEQEKNTMMEAIATTNALKIAVFQKIQDISKRRNPLGIKVLGGQNAYDSVAMDAAKAATTWLSKAQKGE